VSIVKNPAVLPTRFQLIRINPCGGEFQLSVISFEFLAIASALTPAVETIKKPRYFTNGVSN